MTMPPGNNLLPLNDEKKFAARENRYGLQGDNGFDAIVNEERRKSGILESSKKQAGENILDFTQKSASKKSDHSIDLQPVKEEKRKIVNQKS